MTAERSADARFAEAETAIPFRLRRDLLITEATDPNTGGKKYFVKVTATGEVFEFGEEELFICQSLNAATSSEELRDAFEARFGVKLSARKLVEFLADLREMGLLVASGRASSGTGARPPFGSAVFEDVLLRDQAARSQRHDGEDRRPLAVKGNLFRWNLFNPERMLARLAWFFRPLRYLTWLLVPAVLLAAVILFHRHDAFETDFRTNWGTIVIVPRLFAGFLIISLLCSLAQGAVATAFGARIQAFGVTLVLGFLPRFYCEMLPVAELPRRGKLWSYAAPLLVRLAIFAVGILIWISYRSTGTWWPAFALLVSQLALIDFFITAIPFAPNDGYFWSSTYLGYPGLAKDAVLLCGRFLKGRGAPAQMPALKKWALIFFVLGVFIFLGLLYVPTMLYLGILLESRFSGTGVVIFFIFFAFIIMWLVVTRRWLASMRKAAVPAGDPHRAVAPFRQDTSAVVPFHKELPALRPHTPPDIRRDLAAVERRRKRSRLLPALIWAAVIGGVAVVAFLPYPYEAGGEFTVLPSSKVEVHTRADGEVIKVMAREGDWVEEGQVLAQLSAWDKERDVAVTAAELDKSRAKLQRLLDGAKIEEVELARKQVESARSRVTFSELQAKRAEILIKEGHIAQSKADEAFTELAQHKADLAVAEANLQLVKSSATNSEIEALRAEVRGYEKELSFRKDELERTFVRAPAAGRIVTPNLHFALGKYLIAGALFAELQDNRMAQVEVDVPESDVAQVKIGRQVRVKAWKESDVEEIGRVVAIAPVAEKRDYGKVVRALTEIPNADGSLKSGMTGYAKIEGSEMPVWEAYSRMFVRFFRIEFWSWIP